MKLRNSPLIKLQLELSGSELLSKSVGIQKFKITKSLITIFLYDQSYLKVYIVSLLFIRKLCQLIVVFAIKCNFVWQMNDIGGSVLD